jgi:hypothetical protein
MPGGSGFTSGGAGGAAGGAGVGSVGFGVSIMYYSDIEYKCRTDGQFRSKLLAYSKRMAYFAAKAKEGGDTYRTAYNETLWKFIQFTNFNLVFLTEHYFPKYPKDKPLNFSEYPFAFQMFEFQIGGYNVFRGSRQISKSTSFSARQLLNSNLFPGFKSLYICPRNQQLATYANKLKEIERASLFASTENHKFRRNLNLKEFEGGSSIELAYVLTNASVVRGKSADELLYDEAQDFDPDLEIEVGQIQSASEMPVTIYAGTSLTTESFLEQKYSASSMCSWTTRCGCGTYNIPLPEHRVLDQIQPQGPSCWKCGRLLDIRNGRFVAADWALHDKGRRGFHIPQIIIPAVFNNPIRWADIYEKKVKMGGDRKFLQEILGVATEEGEREITKKNLMDICILPDLRVLHEKARSRQYQFVISGCDWGGSDYIPAEHIKISTTVHVMVGITTTGAFEIIHIRRYSGMNYDDIAGDIIHNHEALNGMAIATDFGVGAVYNSKLRERLPAERHLIFNYVGPDSNLLSEPAKAHIYNQWSLNKTESISMTYAAVRERRFRCFKWEQASEYLMDFMNMYRAPAEKAGSGATTFLYRSSASRPNDTLQAVNYCHMLGKILLGEPMFPDIATKIRLEQALGATTFGMFNTDPRNIGGSYSG